MAVLEFLWPLRKERQVWVGCGRIAEGWRGERSGSFTLLSPNWQTRLPGHHYRQVDPDGFRTGPEVVALLALCGPCSGAHRVTVHDARSTPCPTRTRSTRPIRFSPMVCTISTCAGWSGRGSGRPADRVDGTVVTFAGNLDRTFVDAEGAALRFRVAVDDYVRRKGLDAPEEATARTSAGRSVPWIRSASRSLDLRGQRISAVIWATDFRADRSWLPPQAVTESGDPDHARGVAALPGLYFLGLKWMHRRSSHTIDGIGFDADFLAGHISARHVDGERMAA